MQIVLVTLRGRFNGGVVYEHQVKPVKSISEKMVLIEGSFDYRSRYDKCNLDKILFNDLSGGNDHSTTSLRLKKVTLCPDDKVDVTIQQLESDLSRFALDEIKRRKQELAALETAFLSTKK